MAQQRYTFDIYENLPGNEFTPEECEYLNQVDQNASNFIQPRTKTLGELYQHVARIAGNEFFDIHDCFLRCMERSVIRSICRYVAEYQDGTPVDLMFGNYHRLVQPVGTVLSILDIQRTFRGFLGRRVARERHYRPNGPGYQRVRKEFESLL